MLKYVSTGLYTRVILHSKDQEEGASLNYTIRKAQGISGEIIVPGDKSISHRALMMGSIADGATIIKNLLISEDCLCTLKCIKDCGIRIGTSREGYTSVYGRGLKGLRSPGKVLYAGNSGTTMRLISGILCPQEFDSTITGDGSLTQRPMDRIIKPLKLMGASIRGTDDKGHAPLFIRGSRLRGIEYKMPVASAQVKSALIFASLYAVGDTIIHEPCISRNHTELMIQRFGGTIRQEGNLIVSSPVSGLMPQELTVPGDISSASYFMAAAAILTGSHIEIKGVGINPTRRGILDALMKMGAYIELKNEYKEGGEPVADINVYGNGLKGIEVSGQMIPSLVDEIPVLCAAAAFADGTTYIKDAEELRYKETDRIKAMVSNLRLLGADVEEKQDGIIIHGGKTLHGNVVESFGDHRIAMAMAVMGLAIDEGLVINNAQCVSVSYPGFFDVLESVAQI